MIHGIIRMRLRHSQWHHLICMCAHLHLSSAEMLWRRGGGVKESCQDFISPPPHLLSISAVHRSASPGTGTTAACWEDKEGRIGKLPGAAAAITTMVRGGRGGPRQGIGLCLPLPEGLFPLRLPWSRVGGGSHAGFHPACSLLPGQGLMLCLP